MRALVRHATAVAADGQNFEMTSSWQPLVNELLSSTRTPSSADGGLSTLSSPTAPRLEGSDGMYDEDALMFEPMSFNPPSGAWRNLSHETGAEGFDFDDGFALPPPALGLEELGMVLGEDDSDDMEIVPVSPCSRQVQSPAEVKVQEPKAVAPVPVLGPVQKATRAVANILDLMRLEEKAALSAMMEHWAANPARRDALRRSRGAVRVGRRRVALRQRPMPPTSRRYAPCSGR